MNILCIPNILPHKKHENDDNIYTKLISHLIMTLFLSQLFAEWIKQKSTDNDFSNVEWWGKNLSQAIKIEPRVKQKKRRLLYIE